MDKKSDEDKHYNWMMGADMYLATAVILCDKMLESYISPIEALNSVQQIDKKCGFTSANPDYEMLMPVVFNLKHGAELYIKALIMQTHPKLEYPTSHDLLALLDVLIKNLRTNGLEDNIVNALDQDARAIIEKYYYGLYAFSTVKTTPDINNEAERYSEYRNANCYQIKELFNVVNVDLVESIKKDCVILQRIFREEIYRKI